MLHFYFIFKTVAIKNGNERTATNTEHYINHISNLNYKNDVLTAERKIVNNIEGNYVRLL